MIGFALELGRLPSELPWDDPTTEISWILAYYALLHEEQALAEIEAQTKAGPKPGQLRRPPA